MIKTIIADDNRNILEILKKILDAHEDIEVIDVCENGIELVEKYVHWKPDLMIVDVDMPYMSGIEAIKACVEIKHSVNFIFLTGYEKYALDAFELEAIDYLIKPISKLNFYRSIEKAKKVIELQAKKRSYYKLDNLAIKYPNGVHYIRKSSIFFIHKSGKKSYIYTKDQIIETNEKISGLIKKLDNSFFLAHRSYIINLKKISHIHHVRESFIAYFDGLDKHANISKLKISELKEMMASLTS